MKSLREYSFIAFLGLIILPSYGLALVTEGESVKSDARDDTVYPNYYENEGKLIFKAKGSLIRSSAKQKALPKSPNSSPSSVGNLVQDGLGAEGATVMFFNDNLAAELSLGFNALNSKASSLKDVANNYGGVSSSKKKSRVYMIPLGLTAQYQFAPFGGIKPYVGAGWHVCYLFSPVKDFKIGNATGPILQLGVDLVANDDTLINLDLKQYYAASRVKYKGNIVRNVQGISSNVKLNPTVLSVGLGFKL